jgi:hypothetical protein
MRNEQIVFVFGAFALLVAIFVGIFGIAQANNGIDSNVANVNRLNAPTGPITVYLPLVTKNYVAPAPLWRFGVAQSRRALSDYNGNDIASLRAGWYVNFGTTSNAPQPYGIEYVPTVRVKQWKLNGSTWTEACVACPYVQPYTYTVSPSRDQIRSIAASRPGMTWVIGNEIERRDWANSDNSAGRQDEILPEVYAVAYNDLDGVIKQADSTAQVAIAGMVEWTPLRQQYLERVWTAYQQYYGQSMPVDVWNIHLYPLQEVSGSFGAGIPAGIASSTGAKIYSITDNKNFNIVINDMIVPMRTWMKQHGQQNKPLITNEYGVLFPDWVSCQNYPNTSGCPFTPDQVRTNYMYPSFNYFLNQQVDANLGYPADGNRLVQRWNWYSLDDDNGSFTSGVFYQNFNGNLMYSGIAGSSPSAMGMAPLGTYWSQYVFNLTSSSAKPYAPQTSPVQFHVPKSAPIVPSNWVSPATCSDNQKIRLELVEPSPPGTVPGLSKQATPPKVTKVTTICAPIFSK